MILKTEEIPIEFNPEKNSKYYNSNYYQILRSALFTAHPKNSIVNICSDDYPRNIYQLSDEIKRELGVEITPDNIRNILKYFTRLTFFINSERIKKGTKFGSYYIPRTSTCYWKEFDGYYIGDVFSIINLEASYFLVERSNHTTSKVFGRAHSRGETEGQIMSLLVKTLMYYINKDKPRFRVKELLENIFGKGFKGREYDKMEQRLTHYNLPRLNEAGVLKYESKKSEEENIYRLNENSDTKISEKELEFIREKRGRRAYSTVKNCGNIVLEILKKENELSTSEISERIGKSKGYARDILFYLRDLNKIEMVKGWSFRELSNVYPNDIGKELFDNYYKEPLEIIDFIDEIDRKDYSCLYEILNRKARIDWNRLKKKREELIDSILEDYNERVEFEKRVRKVIEVYENYEKRYERKKF